MKDLIAKLHSDSADQILATFSTLEMQLQGFAKSSYEKDLRIAELEAQIAASADTDKLREALPYADKVVQFLNHLEDVLDDENFKKIDGKLWAELTAPYQHSGKAALQAPVREVPEGWAFSTADFSVQASGSSKYGYVTLKRDAKGSAAWHALDDMQKDATELYLYGKGETVAEAIADAVSKIDAAPLPAAPVQEPKP